MFGLGISSRGDALSTTIDTVIKVFSTNFYGNIELTRAVAEDMIKYNKVGSSIAVISSVQGMSIYIILIYFVFV